MKAASDNKATANAKVAAVAEAAAAAVKAAADAKAAAGDKAAPALVGHGTAEAVWAMVPAGSPTPKGQQRGNLCCPSSHIRKASLEEEIETLNDQIQRMRQLLTRRGVARRRFTKEVATLAGFEKKSEENL